MLAKHINTIKNTALRVKTRLKAVFFLIVSYLHLKFFWGIFKNIDEKFFKFLFVGALNAFFAYVIYAFFVALSLKPNFALFFQYIIGVLWNFKTTGSIVFKNKDNALLFKFILTYVFTFLINSFLLHNLVPKLGNYLSQALLIPFMAVISFLLFKFWVFKKD